MVSSCSRCISHSTVYSVSSANTRWKRFCYPCSGYSYDYSHFVVYQLSLWIHFFFFFFFSTKLSVVNCSPYFNLIKLILCLLTFRCIFYFFFFSLYLAKEQYFIPGRFGSAVRLTNCRYSLPFTPKAKFVIAFRKLMHVY